MDTQYKIITTLLMLISLGCFFAACNKDRTPEEKKLRQIETQCRSKVRGSTPACWNEHDWAAFCKHVQCTRQ